MSNKILFDLENHKYFWLEKPNLELTSVTRVISQYYEYFDEEAMSLRISKKRKVSQESIKEEWAKIREEAEERGSAYHKFREQAQLEKSDSYRHISNTTYKLSLDLDNLETGFYPELMLVHPNFNIAGTADSVEIFSDGTFNLSDYKTNKSLDFNSFQVYDQRLRKRVPKMMYEPVSHLEDCNGNHYALQLSMYAYILES